ncbi:MAG: hypothetical protein R3285_04280, partial [Kiloniellales bacterium]|nr:hypothetical protein [Kiloniellales bacterium]
ELAHETLSVDPGASLEARLSRLSKEKKIAAQIPKPKLSPPRSEPPVREAAEDKPTEDKPTEDKPTEDKSAEDKSAEDERRAAADRGKGESQDSPGTDIPDVFDRRKKQATG